MEFRAEFAWPTKSILFAGDMSKMLEKQNEVLGLLRGKSIWLNNGRHFQPQSFIIPEIKADNENLRKSMLLQVQVCRQEIIDKLRDLKRTFRHVIQSAQMPNDLNGFGVNGIQNVMDAECLNDDVDDDEDCIRWIALFAINS